MRNRLFSTPVKIGLGLGFGLVVLVGMLSESQGADDPRASLRVSNIKSAAAGRSANDQQLYRQAGRLRRLVREQVRAQKEDEATQPFARTREEAERKILEALVKESEGTVQPPQTSLSSIGLCDDALKPSESASALDALRPHEHLSRHLSIDWSISPDEEQGHRALEKALGRPRYLEVARTCAAKQSGAVSRETESALLLVSKELGLNEKAANQALKLLEARDKELAAANPEQLQALDEHGKLPSQPSRSAREMAALQAKQNSIEARYTAQFKQLIGPEKWRKYESAVIGSSGAASDLYWAQFLLFREPESAAAAPAAAAPAPAAASASAAKQIKLIPNKF